MRITDDIFYVGVNDRDIDLFEGQYKVPNGMSYNSYVIRDEKIAVTDTVDARFKDQWLKNLEDTLGGRTPDYLVVSHMEPDHSANIDAFAQRYPNAVIVASKMAFTMMSQFFGTDYADRRVVVGEGDTLELGAHTLKFFTAPLVHWPEVIVSYDTRDKVLFSADAFGKFGALDVSEDWTNEARRYYIGIVGKFGAQTQALLKKASMLDISMICPLHGPVLKDDLGKYLELYNTWSSYVPEEDGVVIAYSSVYGNTEKAVNELKDLIEKKGCKVAAYDLARCDTAAAVADAFRYSKLVLATTTYNGGIFPCMKEYIDHLIERNYQNRTVGIIENGTWAPMAAKNIKAMLENCKDLTLEEPVVTIRSALNAASTAKLEELASALAK